VAAFYYNNAINLPYKYEAACNTVTETKELLMRYENLTEDQLGNLGYGLESLKLKTRLEEAIKEKNNLYADIQSWLNNPLIPFKDIIENNLENINK